ncbi:leucine-rich repeat transmembrane protein FLRT3-like [Mytilus edulis]|uniref:leucine-rich repeat transmembrane protein FLRT3-like n=1 Tax=Mytilus edulis TaxID=6550 RepID=UPI0039EF3FEE
MSFSIDRNLVNSDFADRFLQENQITILEENIFKDLTALGYLDLANNQITTIDVNVLNNLIALHGINLADNPLKCVNCIMQRLKTFLERLPLGYLAVCDDGTLVNDLNFDNCPEITEKTTKTTTQPTTSVTETSPMSETTTGETTTTITTTTHHQTDVIGINTDDNRIHFNIKETTTDEKETTTQQSTNEMREMTTEANLTTSLNGSKSDVTSKSSRNLQRLTGPLLVVLLNLLLYC